MGNSGSRTQWGMGTNLDDQETTADFAWKLCRGLMIISFSDCPKEHFPQPKEVRPPKEPEVPIHSDIVPRGARSWRTPAAQDVMLATGVVWCGVVGATALAAVFIVRVRRFRRKRGLGGMPVIEGVEVKEVEQHGAGREMGA